MSIDAIRTANKPDAEAIAQLVNKAYRPEIGTAGWTHESDLVSGNRISVGQVAEVMSKPDSVIFVGLRGSDIVTCVHVEKDGRNSYIGMLAVNPNLQGAGAGKQMLAHAERYANESFSSEKFIMAVVSSRSELIAFYLRRGYQKTGAVQDYPLSAGVGIPKISDLTTDALEKRSNTQAGCAGEVKLYGTEFCHLCEKAEAILNQAEVSTIHIDIAEDDDLLEKYGTRIPVLQRADNDAELGWPFDAASVAHFLS